MLFKEVTGDLAASTDISGLRICKLTNSWKNKLEKESELEEIVVVRGNIMDLFLLLQKNYSTFSRHGLDNK